MAYLERQDRPCTAAEIARGAQVSPSSVLEVLMQLDTAGLLAAERTSPGYPRYQLRQPGAQAGRAISDVAPDPAAEAARRIAEFLARLPSDPAALLAMAGPMQVTEEAELAAAGIHPVSVVHGDLHSGDDQVLVFIVLPELARAAGPYARMRGGSDYMTWFFDGPGAERAAIAFISGVTAIAPDQWVVTPTAQPKFYR